jgi:hypothetical protein
MIVDRWCYGLQNLGYSGLSGTQSNPGLIMSQSLYYIGWFLSVTYLFIQEELKRAAPLGVFGVADHEFDIRLAPRLGIRTRKVEKSVKFS